MPDLNIETDDDNVVQDDAAETTAPKRPDTAKVLGSMALDAALSCKQRTALGRHPGIVVVRVPTPEWASVIGGAIKRVNTTAVICPATELLRKSATDRKIGASELGWVQQGRTLVVVSQDPAHFIDEVVLAAADLTLAIPALSPALLGKVIRQVTGGIARKVTPEMAQLDLPLIVSLVRPELTARQCVANLQRVIDCKPAAPVVTGPLLSELPLTQAVRTWSAQLTADLAAVQAGTLAPDQLVFATLEGPPGTGKTLVAEALARSAGWTFVSSSVGDWFTRGDGALGGVSRNLKDFIDQLLTGEPTVGFMDELDALPDRATMDERAREWWTSIVTLFLVQIDRLKKSGQPVLLIGATNYFDRLDAALIRPGRLQQRVSVLAPESDADVLQLLRHFLKADLTDAALEKLVRLAYRATPAQVEGWTKQARAAARAQGRSLELADLIAQMAPNDPRSPQDLRTVALHEIGHAVVAVRLGMTVESVSVIPKGGAGGYTLTKRITTVPTLPQLNDMVTVALGGRAADLVLGQGANAGAEADLAEATEWLLRAHETLGLRDMLASRHAIGGSARPRVLLDAVEADLQSALAKAIAIITADREVVLGLAERLMQEKVLNGSDIADAVAVAPPARAVHAPSPHPAVPPPQDDQADEMRGALPYGH